MRVNRHKIRIIAQNILNKYNITIPINFTDLLKKMNIDLELCPFLPARVAGASIPVKHEYSNGLIVLNKNMIRTRQRFTIAHEIYHIIQHFKNENEFYFMINSNNSISHSFEREADIFASELLMPKNAVVNAFYQQHLQSVEELSNFFWVSKQAMQIRLDELGIADFDKTSSTVVN